MCLLMRSKQNIRNLKTKPSNKFRCALRADVVLPIPGYCLSGYPESIVHGIIIGGKGIGIIGIPGGLPLIIRFSPGQPSGINPASQLGTLILVIQGSYFHPRNPGSCALFPWFKLL
jgi:hypothetical protein